MAQQQATSRDNVRILRPSPNDLPAEALPPGTRLDEFEILGVLGTGGFGIVYLATDLSLDRRVAIKEYLPVQLARRGHDGRVQVRAPRYAAVFAQGLQAFTREARLLAGLDHPAMVKVHRHWNANGSAYMAMHYVQGETLRQARRRGRLPASEEGLRALLAPLLDTLEILHACGVTHRDIAPDNILLRPDGSPVLLDFGSARRAADSTSDTLTAALKPCFAPIEQYGETTQVRQGPWTDVYALGGVIAYLLEGRPPSAATARAVHDDRLPLAERGVAGMSRNFLAAIDWALAVKPQDRPQSIAEFRNALEGRLRAPRQRGADTTSRLHLRAAPALASAAGLLLVAATWLATPQAPRDADPLLSSTDSSATVGGSGSMVRTRDAVVLGRMPAERLPTVAAARDAETAAPAAVPLPAATPAVAAVAPDVAARKSSARPPQRLAAAPLVPPPSPRHVARDDPLRSCMSGHPLMRALCMNQRCIEPRFQAHPRCAYMQRDEHVLVGRKQIAGR